MRASKAGGLIATRDPDEASGRRWRDHPRGLWVLAATQFWDIAAFYGMQAMLALYLAHGLLQPPRAEGIAGFAAYRAGLEALVGPLSPQALAAQTVGLFIGLVYLTPILGGAIGDRVTGRRPAIVAGALMMSAGHFALVFDASFLVALLLLAGGAGLLRGNLLAQVGSLYPGEPRREADGFQLYYLATYLGAFVAPLAMGALAAAYGWHAGFALGGVGMLAGLAVYLIGGRWLPADGARVPVETSRDPADRRRVLALLAIWPVLLGFWIAQTQVWNVYPLWANDHVDLVVAGFAMPVPWLMALDGLAPALLLPLILPLWRRQAARGREPTTLVKLAIGCALLAAAMLLLTVTPLLAGADRRVPLAWPVLFHLVGNMGWIYFTPVTVALFATEAPPRLRATMIGVNALAVFAGGTVSGRIGGLYETLSPTAFWLIHAAIVGAAALMILLLARPLGRVFTGGAAGPIS